MTPLQDIIQKFHQKSATIAVIGQGYVGLPLAVAFAEIGFQVTGLDVDERKIEAINRGQSYIQDIASSRLKPLVDTGYFKATTNFAILSQTDAVIICVPTPLSKTKDPDMSFIIAAADEIARYVHRNQLIVLESTTYPGTTQEIILPRIIKNGYRVGEDFFLAFSPERTDPGRTDYTIKNTPKVVGGVSEACLQVAQTLYEQIIDKVVPVSSTAAAEMVKLLENTFRAVNIGLINEVTIMCDKLGLDVWEIIAAAETKPYGFMSFYPGPGLGGHCIPVDPHYLAWKLRTLNYSARFIELATEVNYGMPEYVVHKISDSLNEDRKPLNGSVILLVGVAYKPNVSDVRESPALDIISLLKAKGTQVLYHDPFVPEIQLDDDLISSVSLSAGLSQADCVVIVTDHTDLAWFDIFQQAQRIVDTRNAFAKMNLHSPKIKGLSA